MMAGLGRASSFLPTIKCSSCARDIEISQMGDHVCGPSAGEPTPPPDSQGSFLEKAYRQPPTNDQRYLRPNRAMPPRVDTSAANRPFFSQDQLTPVSASPSRSISPMTPRSPFGKPMRSATAPLNRGPPSPELLSSNLDCAFPPFPTSKSNGTQKRQQDPGYGAGSRMYVEPDQMYGLSPDQMYAPVSPRMETGQGVIKRMNSIAPGPFDVNKPQSLANRAPGRGHQRQPTAGSLGEATMSSRREDMGAHSARPTTANGHSRSSTNSSNESRSGPIPPRMPRTNGYGGFGPPPNNQDSTREPAYLESRSQTFPLPSESKELPIRRPSEPSNNRGFEGAETGSWPLEQGIAPNRSPPKPDKRNPSMSGPDLSRPLPPRAASIIRPRTATAPGDVPPLPEVNLAEEFGVGNPYHTPTTSQSSNASGYSEESKTSSRSSPPRSAASNPRRKPSNVKQVDDLMSEIQSSMADLQPRELPSTTSPPRNRGQPTAPGTSSKFGPSLQSPESQMKPALQNDRLSPNLSRNPERQNPMQSERGESPARRPSRPTTAKGNCKGCGEVIKGKSVSSADGRLTGRYHKQCFVCQTCLEPFQTATFYVIEDAPYCERHYHKLNGSVCHTCDKGIEGQYLESESKQKFHPGCLACSDCKRNLRNDYFEMNGRVFCERDAFRRAQQGRNLGIPGAGTNRMERRTTRLMMM